MQRLRPESGHQGLADAGPGWPGSVLRKRRGRSERMTASPGIPRARVVSCGHARNGVTSPPPHPLCRGAAVERALRARVTRCARCADSGLDLDQWFPVSVDPARARQDAAAAIAVCISPTQGSVVSADTGGSASATYPFPASIRRAALVRSVNARNEPLRETPVMAGSGGPAAARAHEETR
jgi:hypothetical protein